VTRWVLALTIVVAAALAAAQLSTADAAVQANCLTSTKRDPLALTNAKGLDDGRIIGGLGLTPDQVRAVSSRLASYGGSREFTLDGLGLTPDQISEIKRRIAVQVAEWNKYPLGWPCAPFKNRALVIKFTRAQLIYNGFRPNMTFTVASPRQIQFNAIQDGIRYIGTLVKTAPRQITVRLISTSGGDTSTFRLGFEA
jgi:hypothetical protein